VKLTMERAAVRRRPLMAISDSAYVTGLQRLERASEDRAELQVRSDLIVGACGAFSGLNSKCAERPEVSGERPGHSASPQ
jgi:hypothetical protein